MLLQYQKHQQEQLKLLPATPIAIFPFFLSELYFYAGKQCTQLKDYISQHPLQLEAANET